MAVIKRAIISFLPLLLILSGCNSPVNIPKAEIKKANKSGADQMCRFFSYHYAIQDEYIYIAEANAVYRKNSVTGEKYKISSGGKSYDNPQVSGEYVYVHTYEDWWLGAVEKGLTRISINGDYEKRILSDYLVKDFVATPEKLYFTTGSCIYAYDTNSESVEKLMNAITDHIAVFDDYVYYSTSGTDLIDINRFSLKTTEHEYCLSDFKADVWMIDGEYVYYGYDNSKLNTGHFIKRIRLDGKDDTFLFKFENKEYSSSFYFNIFGNNIYVLYAEGQYYPYDTCFIAVSDKLTGKEIKKKTVPDIGVILTSNDSIYYTLTDLSSSITTYQLVEITEN